MGGMQKHSYYLAKYLAKNKVEVELYHCVSNDKPLVEVLEGFTEEELKYIRHHCFYFPKLDSFLGHYIRENKKMSELYLSHYLDSKPETDEDEFIYAKGFTGIAFLKAKKESIIKNTISTNYHGLEMFQKAPSFRVKMEHLLLRPTVKYVLNNSDIAISYGGKISNILKKVTDTKIVEIVSGINQSWINNQSINVNTPVEFVFVGRFERRKGIEELNAVLETLIVEPNIKFHFSFIGPIPDDKKLDSDKIHYYGSFSDENKIKEILQNSDVLVTPSWSEGMPNVILEAMASGCAIIATDVGAVSEQVDITNGWLIEAGNKHQLKEAIISAINSTEENLLDKKKASIEKIKNKFLWDDIVKKTIKELF